MNRLRVLLILFAVMVLAGCATNLDKNATTIDLAKESVVILGVDFVNEYRPSFGLSSVSFAARKEGDSTNQVRFATKPSNQPQAVIVGTLPPGQYKLTKLLGNAPGPFIIGRLNFDLEADFTVPANSVVYLGHLDVKNVERVAKDDQASGGLLPIVDQGIAGFSGGTLRIGLEDRYQADVDRAKSEYPALRTHEVLRSPIRQLLIAPAGNSGPAKRQVKLGGSAG